MSSHPALDSYLYSSTMGRLQPALYYLTGALVTITILLLAATLISTPHDPLEPPLIQSRIPYVGHALSLARDRVVFFRTLHRTHHLPIVSVPFHFQFLGLGKTYVVFSAPLQKAAMNEKKMDARDLTADFIPPLFGIRRETLEGLLGRDGRHEDMTPYMHDVFRRTLMGGDLDRITRVTLGELGDVLEGIGEDGLRVPNLYYWIRGFVSEAISVGLYGRKHNPFLPVDGREYEMVDTFWDFEAAMGSIVLGFFPSIIARKGYLARAKLASILLPYYKAGYDQTEETSALVKERGRLFRKWDMPVDEIAKNEVAVMLVAVANTIPTMFWLFYHVWTRPELVDRLQQEAAQHVACLSATEGKLPPAGVKEITITYSSIGETCPLLHSCFREVARLASQNATLRRVLEDTVLRDENGQSWVLKKGNNVILPGECLHRDRDTWGEDADEFNPERFLPNNTPTKKKERLRKLSYVPFGGGRHLCPGRRFALAETLSFMAALVLGFDVEGLDPEKTRMQWSKMGQAAKPLPGYEGGPVTVRRRKGWEHVVWKFDA